MNVDLKTDGLLGNNHLFIIRKVFSEVIEMFFA